MWRGTVLTDCAVQVHIGEEVTQLISVAYSLSVTYSLKSYCKMPPKQATSKKSKEKKKTQAIADATFGLKNKNKSAKVQNYVKQVESSMKNNLSDAVRLYFHNIHIALLLNLDQYYRRKNANAKKSKRLRRLPLTNLSENC